MNKAVYLKASKIKLNADTPGWSNCFTFTNDCGKNASCSDAMSCKLLPFLVMADTYTFLMNTWNTLPESYQQRIFKNTLATVQHQSQQAANRIPAVVISVDAAGIENAILLIYATSKAALEEPGIGPTDYNATIDNNCMDDVLHVRMPRGSGY